MRERHGARGAVVDERRAFDQYAPRWSSNACARSRPRRGAPELLLVEHPGERAPSRARDAALRDSDARRLPSAVLEREEAEVRQPRDVALVGADAEHAAPAAPAWARASSAAACRTARRRRPCRSGARRHRRRSGRARPVRATRRRSPGRRVAEEGQGRPRGRARPRAHSSVRTARPPSATSWTSDACCATTPRAARARPGCEVERRTAEPSPARASEPTSVSGERDRARRDLVASRHPRGTRRTSGRGRRGRRRASAGSFGRRCRCRAGRSRKRWGRRSAPQAAPCPRSPPRVPADLGLRFAEVRSR